MTNVIAVLTVVFLTCLLLSVLYWEVVHFVLLKGIRFQLFAMRDDVRRIASERGLGNSFAYQDLEKFICKTIGFAPHVSLVSFIWFIIKRERKKDFSNGDWKRFESEAPDEFKELRDATAKWSIIIMMLNSPWVMILSSILYPIAWATGKLSKTKLYSGAESFVGGLRPEIGAC